VVCWVLVLLAAVGFGLGFGGIHNSGGVISIPDALVGYFLAVCVVLVVLQLTAQT